MPSYPLLRDRRQSKGTSHRWMFKEQIPLYERKNSIQGKTLLVKVREISYLEHLLKFLSTDNRREEEKDIWELDKLDIQFRANPIKRVKTLNFTQISQDDIRQEVKKGIYLNLKSEAIACIIKELTAVRRLSRYLSERHPDVKSCRDIDRKVVEEYLTYLKTEATETKHFHADLNRLRSLLESIGQMCEYPNLIELFLNKETNGFFLCVCSNWNINGCNISRFKLYNFLFGLYWRNVCNEFC